MKAAPGDCHTGESALQKSHHPASALNSEAVSRTRDELRQPVHQCRGEPARPDGQSAERMGSDTLNVVPLPTSVP